MFPFIGGGKFELTLLADAVGADFFTAGMAYELPDAQIAIIDSQLPPISKWHVVTHEAGHTRQRDFTAMAQAMQKLMPAHGADGCQRSGAELNLIKLLAEGLAQWRTHQLMRVLYNIGQQARQSAAPPTPRDSAGLALLFDLDGRHPGGVPGRLRNDPAPPKAEVVYETYTRVYIQEVAVVAAAFKDPETAKTILDWVRGDPRPFFERFGPERIRLMSLMAQNRIDLDVFKLAFERDNNVDHLFDGHARKLFDALQVQRKPATAEERERFLRDYRCNPNKALKPFRVE
jgi:hypothetical protein